MNFQRDFNEAVLAAVIRKLNTDAWEQLPWLAAQVELATLKGLTPQKTAERIGSSVTVMPRRISCMRLQGHNVVVKYVRYSNTLNRSGFDRFNDAKVFDVANDVAAPASLNGGIYARIHHHFREWYAQHAGQPRSFTQGEFPFAVESPA